MIIWKVSDVESVLDEFGFMNDVVISEKYFTDEYDAKNYEMLLRSFWVWEYPDVSVKREMILVNEGKNGCMVWCKSQESKQSEVKRNEGQDCRFCVGRG